MVSQLSHWLPLIAHVAWHAGSRGEERPAALLIGDQSSPLELLRSWHEGPDVAGGEIVTVFEVRDADGRHLRIYRFANHPPLVEVESGRPAPLS